MLGIQGMFTVPVLFILTNTIFFHTARGKEKAIPPKKNLCFNPLLSNVRTEKGKFNSHPSGKKQQQVELNWEDNHCPSHASTGAKMKACSRGPPAPLPEMQNLSNTSQDAWMYYMIQSISVWGKRDMGEQNLADRRKIIQCRPWHSLLQSWLWVRKWLPPFSQHWDNLILHFLISNSSLPLWTCWLSQKYKLGQLNEGLKFSPYLWTV